MNATIMSGVTIGNGAVIAAGSLVSKNVGRYEVWGGNPARLLKHRFPLEIMEALDALQWWDRDLETVRNLTRPMCGRVRSPYGQSLTPSSGQRHLRHRRLRRGQSG